MNKREAEKMYKKLISDDVSGAGFTFLKSTFQKKHPATYSIDEIPLSWRKIYFKTYPRLMQIMIGKHLKNNGVKKSDLILFLQKRRSQRMSKSKSLNLDTISKILHFSAGINNMTDKKNLDESKRMYPSAGARYPLEIYSVVLNSKNIPPGLYHYNIKWDTLELLLKKNLKVEMKKITGQNWTAKSGIIIIITAVFARATIKYKESGWRYIFFEAGHLAQNIYLLSTLLNLKCCAIGGFLDEKIIELLDINPKTELPLYMICIGN